MPANAIVDNQETSQIEMQVDGLLAKIVYRRVGNVIYFIHTEVPPELEGQGIASQMARFALDSAKRQGDKVVPLCPFVAAYIKRHPEYQDLVA
ncbi:MAG: GNAT family N-acetyltransferase [Anaerolineales bacterium]|jgi:hypothetical protein